MDTPISVETMRKVTDKINLRLKERDVKMKNCSVCDEPNSFNVMDAYAVVSVSSKGNHIDFSGRNMPLLPIVCRKCGNTIFLNALVLGLGNDLFDQEPLK